MHLIEITPMPCMICGQGNTPTNDGSPRRFVDLDRDTFWDDPAIICEDCGLRISGMLGAPSGEELHEKDRQIRTLTKDNHELRVQLDADRRRARKLGIQFVPEESVA